MFTLALREDSIPTIIIYRLSYRAIGEDEIVRNHSCYEIGVEHNGIDISMSTMEECEQSQ